MKNSARLFLPLFALLLLFAACDDGSNTDGEPGGDDPTESEFDDWAKIRDCYREAGYKFFSDFASIRGNLLSHSTPEGIVQYRVAEIEMGIVDGQVFPMRLAGEVMNSETSNSIDIDYREEAGEAGATRVKSPAGNVIFMGDQRVAIKEFVFGLTPENEVFTAHFTGTFVESEDPINFQFVATAPQVCQAAPPPSCTQVAANSCTAGGSCTTCVFTRTPAGAINGCTCIVGGRLSWCLWFSVDCVAVACPVACTTRKVPGTQIYICGC